MEGRKEGRKGGTSSCAIPSFIPAKERRDGCDGSVKEGRKEGRKRGRKEGRKEERKEGR
jgi:hypothetical protein